MVGPLLPRTLGSPASFMCAPLPDDACLQQGIASLTEIGRVCLGNLMARIDVEIDIRVIGLMRDIVNFLQAELGRLTALRVDIESQVVCIDTVLGEMQTLVLTCTPLQVYIDMLQARRIELQLLLQQLARALAPGLGISAQIDAWGLLEEAMLCQKSNAQRTLQVIEDVETPEPPVPPPPCPRPV